MTKLVWSSLALALILSPALALAQPGGGAGGGGPGGAGGAGGGGFGGGAGGFDMTQFQQQQAQRRLDNIKTQLAATDEEWKILSDKVQKVVTLQTQLNAGRQANTGGRGGGGGGFGGGAGGGGFAMPVDQTNPVAVAAAALTTTTQDTAAEAEVLKAKLTALRDARKKVQEDLTKAQADLKGLVTVRQEAILVNLGLLD